MAGGAPLCAEEGLRRSDALGKSLVIGMLTSMLFAAAAVRR